MAITFRTNSNPDSPPADETLPAGFILKLKTEVDVLKKQWAELPAIIKEKERKYEAALMFAPPGFDPEAAVEALSVDQDPIEEKEAPEVEVAPEEFILKSPVEEHSDKPTWVGALGNTLTLSGRGQSHQELLSFIRANYPALSVSNGEKGFYNAVARLADRKELVKHGGLLYSATVIKDMQARGEKLPEAPEHQIRRGSSGEIVLEVLKAHPNGIAGPDLRKLVAEVPSAPKSLREHGQYIYNILATLMGTGAVVKEGGVYKLTEKVDEL